jgi:hypothetical protein
MRLAFTYSIVALALATASQALAFGYIAPEKIEAGVAQCSGKHLNSFRCARGIERKVLSGGGKAVRRSGDTLQIRTEKETVTLVDKQTGRWESSIAYSYLGFDRKLNSHLLHVQYLEGDAYMVIHRHSGQRAFLSGFPLASPDGKHFLSLFEDMFEGVNPNNVEVWEVSSGEFHRVAYFVIDWGPHDGRWPSARRALVEKQCNAPTESNPAGVKACGVAKIELSGSEWKLVE